MSSSPDGPRPIRQSGGIIGYALLGFLSLAIASTAGWYFLTSISETTSEHTVTRVYYIVLCIVGIAAAFFLFGVMRSAATLTGTHFGWKVNLGGPVVVWVLVVGGGYLFSQQPDEFDLTVRLIGNDRPNEMFKDATITIYLDDSSADEEFSDNGEVKFKLASRRFGDDLKIKIYSPSFIPKEPLQSMIIPESKLIEIEMIRIEPSVISVIDVNGAQGFQSTGITVTRCNRLIISAEGEIVFAQGRNASGKNEPPKTNPDGYGNDGNNTNGRSIKKYLVDAVFGSLVGKIGNHLITGKSPHIDNGNPGAGFVGSYFDGTSPVDGLLYFGYNDDKLEDNKGSFQVKVTLIPSDCRT